jgi:hypothetical protein
MAESPEAVESRQDFVDFVRALSNADDGRWENPSTDRFLEALSAWVSDTAEPLEPSWRSFAIILTAATMYE